MEFSLARSLEEGYSEISNVPLPRSCSDPAYDKVNPGIGQIVNLYETIVPMRGQAIHTIEKKVASAFEEQQEAKNTNDDLNTQVGSGDSRSDASVLNSFRHPIITDSIVFPKFEQKGRKNKLKNDIQDDSSPPKRAKSSKIVHKFSIT